MEEVKEEEEDELMMLEGDKELVFELNRAPRFAPSMAEKDTAETILLERERKRV